MSTPREIVDERLAKGEITLEEHARIIALLETNREPIVTIQSSEPQNLTQPTITSSDSVNSDDSDNPTKTKKSGKWFWIILLVGFIAIILIKNSPTSYHASSCISSKVSSYDSSNIDYRNKCDYGINVRVCDNQVALEFLSMFDQKDRTQCTNKFVGAGQYIDNFYGAKESSSFLRKAVSHTKMLIGACKPPVWPIFNAEKKVLCPSPPN